MSLTETSSIDPSDCSLLLSMYSKLLTTDCKALGTKAQNANCMGDKLQKTFLLFVGTRRSIKPGSQY